jgi:hypothetical protein
MTVKEKFEAWGLVELMGHQRIAGRISEQAIGGSNLLRVDVPLFDAEQKHRFDFRTVFYGSSAIYALHVIGESEAMELARRGDTRPSYAWHLDKAPALTDGARTRSTFGEPDDDEHEFPA